MTPANNSFVCHELDNVINGQNFQEKVMATFDLKTVVLFAQT